MMRPNTALGSAFLFVALSLGVPVLAPAEETDRRSGRAPLGERPGTFGSAEAIHTLPAFSFTGNSADDFTRFRSSGSTRYCQGGDCVFEVGVMLPAGAIVTEIELSACDFSASGYVVATLYRNLSPDGGGPALAMATTGLPAETPGCDFTTDALTSPETIDNFAYSYRMEVVIGGTDPQTRFEAVRIYYHLQVSPAPAVATFVDVPTSHPFFQVIEALAASGITAGCSASPPQFCPSAPVTRAQMAAFLSVALGLHW